MIKTLILRGLDPPYLIIRVVPSLFHVTILPAHLGGPDLLAIARAQVRANKLDACLVLAARQVVAMPAEGSEDMVADVPFARFDHWSSAPVIDRLKTAYPLPTTDESLRRQAMLEAAVATFSARRAEILRERGMLAVAPYLIGDPAKGGREATPAELHGLAGWQGAGVPVGLIQCADCGGWRGECLDRDPQFQGKIMRVHCRCQNHNRCARCGQTFCRFRLNANHYDARLDLVVHVPGFCAMTHECVAPEGCRVKQGNMDELRELVCDLVEICYDAGTRQRFVGWLRSVRPTMADMAIIVVEMALRHTPVGKIGAHCYSLIGFSPDGEPLIDLQSVQ